MTEQIVLEQINEAECVCTNCKHFSEVEGGFYCSFFSAFLSMESLFVPCDFIEDVEESS